MAQGNPKINKLIKCKGYDWSDFTCLGMMLKKGTNKKPTVVFHILIDGAFKPDRKTWGDIDSWEYIETHSHDDKYKYQNTHDGAEKE